MSVAGTADELFSIKGGNKQVPQHLLRTSQSELRTAEVLSITLNTTATKTIGSYILTYKVASDDKNMIEFYDIIIIATPLTSDQKYQIEFKHFNPPIVHLGGKYHRTVCTIVEGSLNTTFFDLNGDDVIPDIISINKRTFFNSISVIESVERKTKNNNEKVWKIFSQKLLTDKQMEKLFSDVSFVQVIDWLAYPDYDTVKRNDSFKLHDYMFHVNAIEWAASAMEMSVIGAKNVALLAFNAWNQIDGDIKADDQEPPVKRKKTEL